MDEFPDIDLPDWGFSDDVDANVEQVSLGDGYTFREAKGLNHLKDSWSPKWSNLDDAVGLSTYAFLRQRLKLIPFLWTHPITAVQYKVVCQSAKLEHDTYGNAVLSATLERDFNP